MDAPYPGVVIPDTVHEIASRPLAQFDLDLDLDLASWSWKSIAKFANWKNTALMPEIRP